MKTLTLGDFLPHTGGEFPMRLGDGRSTGLLLSEARSLGASPCRGDRDESFALLFSSADPGAVPQGTYTLEHPTLGTLDIFLVPVGPSADGRMQYEAIFN
jgi:hypothetical protein